MESSTASIWSAVIAGLAFVAAAGFGFANLRRARLGPRQVPKWSVDQVGQSGYELHNGGADVVNVALRFIALAPVRVDGEVEWPRFSHGQRALFYPLWSAGARSPDQHRVEVTWTPLHRGDAGVWQSTLPPTI